MKIGIFGDSYVSMNVGLGREELGLAWVEHLALIHEVENFGESATNFHWTYQQWLKHKDKFDYCIVLITDPNRIYIKVLDEVPNRPAGHFFGSISHIEAFKTITTDPEILKILDSVNVWHDYWRDHGFEYHLHNLMIKNVMSHDNVLIIPGFPNSIENYNELYKNLTDIQFWELLQIDPNFDVKTMRCKRKCHLSEENNLVLFELVTEAIQNNDRILNLDISRFKKPAKSLNFYAE